MSGSLAVKLVPESHQSLRKLSLFFNTIFDFGPSFLRISESLNLRPSSSLVLFHQVILNRFQRLASIMGKTKGGFYAVARGRKVGVYLTWCDCQSQVNGFGNARFKKFESQAEAEQFIKDNSGVASASSSFSKTLSMTINGGVKKSQSKPVTINHIPKASYTVSIPRSPQFELPAPSRLQQTRTAILINPLARLSAPENKSSGDGGKRGISTSAKLDKRALRVTEDRVTGAHQGQANSGIDLSTFQVDDEGYVVVFTDGACTKNGRKGAKAGIGVWFGDDHNLNISEPVLGRQTNNTAEIQAAERAIIQAKNAGITKLKLKTDSQFTINCVTMWLNKWKRNNWKLGTGQDVKNREDLEKLDRAMNGVEIKWSYVQGHRGHYGNERADQLAVDGAKFSRT